MWLWLSKPTGSHFGVFGEFTTHFRTYFSANWDVHWGLTGLLTHGNVGYAVAIPGRLASLNCSQADTTCRA